MNLSRLEKRVTDAHSKFADDRLRQKRSGYRLLRFVVSFFIILYGFAKLNGAQFTILTSELDKPMGQVSGFWLTWYYFGYSFIYGNFIGLVQVVGGVLLMFRKTTLLGSCLLFPVVSNIILIDIFYRVDIGALLVALIVEFALVGILAFHRHELLELFWSKQNSLFPDPPSAKSRVFGKYAIRALIIAVPAGFTYWGANYNNRLPTLIDGAWDVVSISPQNEASANTPAVIFFERNRAYMCVFKGRDGSYEQHHFEVDESKRTITIWDEWLSKGNQIFAGTYQLSGDELRLSGKFVKGTAETTLVLKRRNQRSEIAHDSIDNRGSSPTVREGSTSSSRFVSRSSMPGTFDFRLATPWPYAVVCSTGLDSNQMSSFWDQ